MGEVEVILTGRVSGRFSDDGRSISAEEVLSYRYVGTGEQVDVRYRWTATARPGEVRWMSVVARADDLGNPA